MLVGILSSVGGGGGALPAHSSGEDSRYNVVLYCQTVHFLYTTKYIRGGWPAIYA